jgi:hypothetical protein
MAAALVLEVSRMTAVAVLVVIIVFTLSSSTLLVVIIVVTLSSSTPSLIAAAAAFAAANFTFASFAFASSFLAPYKMSGRGAPTFVTSKALAALATAASFLSFGCNQASRCSSSFVRMRNLYSPLQQSVLHVSASSKCGHE